MVSKMNTLPHKLSNSSLDLHSQVLFSDSEYAAYIIGITKSFASYTLRITTLDLMSGAQKKSISVPSSIRSGFKDIITFPRPSNPSVVWLDDGGAIKYRSLLGETTVTIAANGYKKIIDVGLGEQGIFVALLDDETAYVLEVPEEHGRAAPKIIFEFTGSVRFPPPKCGNKVTEKYCDVVGSQSGTITICLLRRTRQGRQTLCHSRILRVRGSGTL